MSESKFTRKIKKAIETEKKPWYKPGYDGLRIDKKAIPKITDKESFIVSCNTARLMTKQFGRKPWMESFIDENGKNLPYKKGLVT